MSYEPGALQRADSSRLAQPKAVSETEEQDLAQLMAKAGAENAEVSGDEDDEEVYSVREICSAAHHQFRRNRFVTRRFDADRFGQRPGEESSGSETDSDANDTSDDSGAEKLKKKLLARQSQARFFRWQTRG